MTRRSPSYTRRSSVGALLPAIASTTARRVREDASRGFWCPAVKSPQPLSLPAETPDINSRDQLSPLHLVQVPVSCHDVWGWFITQQWVIRTPSPPLSTRMWKRHCSGNQVIRPVTLNMFPGLRVHGCRIGLTMPVSPISQVCYCWCVCA